MLVMENGSMGMESLFYLGFGQLIHLMLMGMMVLGNVYEIWIVQLLALFFEI